MTIAAGSRLGPYEVLSPIGAGGMGEVYLARDGKLGRDVAIKVLPEAFAADAERLARFRREAQVLASLNHPHIAAIYGLEESGGVEALVLELVDGETLAERLAKGALPVEEALEIARQIAEALEAAHEKGIVHRDLKPANVKLTPGGQVKVLDFGLAKMFERPRDAAGREQAAAEQHPMAELSPTAMPTLTGMTQAGVVIGTAAYMSPEQARGKSVDKRADIWAFGVVLWEMLTGKRLFEGDTVSDVLAAVLRQEPDWSALPAATPASVRRVLKRCLDRNPKTRLQDIADARLEMDEAQEPAAAAAGVAGRALFQGGAVWTVAAAVFALVAAAGWWRVLTAPRPAPRERTVFTVSIPAGDGLAYDDTPILAFSRDGRRLVYAADRGGARHLFLRALGEIEARPLEGTAGGRGPFFSPDGQWVGFFSEGKLKKVQAGGGPPQTICDDVTAHRGAAWAEDDTIVLTPEYAAGLFRVSARGGKLEPLTKPDAGKGERTHRWPEVLPGGEAVLFTIGYEKSPGNYDDAKIAILDRKTGRTRILLEGASMARYAPSGHILFVRARSLLAMPFDLARREVTGEPFPVPEKIAGDPSSGIGYFAVGGDGSLAFVPGGTPSAEGRLVLTDRKGAPTELPLPQRQYRYPRFSADGRKIAFSIGGGRGNDDDVWVYEPGGGALTRLTFSSNSFCPIWSRDGRRVAYASSRGKAEGIYARAADGSGVEDWLFEDFTARLPSDWSLDGKTLIFTHPSNEVWLGSLTGEKKARPFQPRANSGVYSPDDRWIAYSAAGSAGAVSEIFVQAADGTGGKWQLTTDGANLPAWAGNEIFSLHGGQIRSVEVHTQPTFKAGLPRTLFEGQFELRTAPLRNYDVTRDGQRFIFIRGGSEVGAKEVDVILNWAQELGRSPTQGKKP